MREEGVSSVVVGVIVIIIAAVGVGGYLLGRGGRETPISQLPAIPKIDSIIYEKGLDLEGYYLTATITVSNLGEESDLFYGNIYLGKLVDSEYGTVSIFGTEMNFPFGTIEPGGTYTKTTGKLRPGFGHLPTDQFYLQVEVWPGPGGSFTTFVNVGSLIV